MKLHPSLIVLCLVLCGCNIAGMFEYAVVGPPVQPARYEPKNVPTLVIVENYGSPSDLAIDADRFAGLLAEQLRANRVVPVVDPGKLYGLRERAADYHGMKISEIGRALGAGQVIYVDLAASEVERSGTAMMRGRMSMRVKLIDVETGRTLWPQDAAEGYPIVHETPMVRISETDRPEMLKTRMLQDMAQRTARLFYDWKPSDLKEAKEGAAG